MMSRLGFLIFLAIILFACNTDDDITGMIDNPVIPEETQGLYFPPLYSDTWETTTPEDLGWNTDKLAELDEFLVSDNTKSFMILVDGRIVFESYYNDHTANDTWKWNSAGKTLVTMMTGMAAQEDLINITSPVSDYLGEQWTSLEPEQESLIQPIHLMTMTSGLNDERQLVSRENMTYIADAGIRWSYSNVFQNLIDIVSSTSNQDYEDFFEARLANKIGMEGYWNFGLIFSIYHSTTRSMARFGLLALNSGAWNGDQIINPSFFDQSVTSSQNLNPSYGYMWWLNGQSHFMLPGSQEVHDGPLVPNAPADMYAAMGANDQRLYIIPSMDMVVIRMGEASEVSRSEFALSNFDNLLWGKLKEIFE